MCTVAVHWGWLDTVPGFPDRLRENPPRQGFFEHPEYLAVRAHLPAPWQDILDLAYYSGWRKQEILGLTWDEIDEAGGVIRLSPGPLEDAGGPDAPHLTTHCRRTEPTAGTPRPRQPARLPPRRHPRSDAGARRGAPPASRLSVPTRFLHDCRRTAARNLIRASVPERVAMLLTGHKSRAIFDRYNIIHEQELLDAGDQLVEYLAQQAQAGPALSAAPHGGPAAPRPHHPSASYDAAPRKGARPRTGAWPGAAVPGHRPPVRRGSRTGHRYEPARDRGTRGDGAGRRRRTRAHPGPDRASKPRGPDALLGDTQSDRLGGGSPNQRR